MSGTTSAPPKGEGDTAKALASIKAKTLILTGTKDLLNPEFEPIEMGKNIPDVKIMTISPGSVTGHASAGGGRPADVDFLNREVGGVSRCGDGRREEAELSELRLLPCSPIYQRHCERSEAIQLFRDDQEDGLLRRKRSLAQTLRACRRL
jgi:hypothetical protein